MHKAKRKCTESKPHADLKWSCDAGPAHCKLKVNVKCKRLSLEVCESLGCTSLEAPNKPFFETFGMGSLTLRTPCLLLLVNLGGQVRYARLRVSGRNGQHTVGNDGRPTRSVEPTFPLAVTCLLAPR